MSGEREESNDPLNLFGHQSARFEQVVTRFEEAWQRGDKPRIEEYLAGEDAPKRLLLQELVRIDLEWRLKAGEAARVEQYLDRFRALAEDSEFVLRLIHDERRQRGRCEAELSDEEFLVRFPQYRSALVQREQLPRGTDYHLLFGLLALQNVFISREELVAATGVWLANKSKPLGEILLQRKALAQDEFKLLSALVDKHLEKHGDDVERSLATLSSIGPLREQLLSLGDSELEQSLGHVSVMRESETCDPQPPETLAAADQRFRVLRPHARGGLGQVSVAVDEELNREVALKEILPQHAEHIDSRSRFVLEAEITGGLEHPGIVPVYSLGQYDNGRPFYVMRFIKGDSLEEAIKRFHATDWTQHDPGERTLQLRKLLSRFIDVCQAIEYAHSRGVLHRDLKPGNIMLGKYGETLVVDWGLAKLLGHRESQRLDEERTLRPRSGSGTAPTQMGTAIGTPAFMPPEQAAGKLDELGPGSDVYSLGATLYYLLTGQPPFSEKELGMLLGKVRAGDFQRPRDVRRDVPRSLEAVCLKAMALRYDQRYTSPHDLAEDVEHWLGDEQVSARRESLFARCARWQRHHRSAVAALIVLLVTSVIALSFGTVLLQRANRRENELRAQAENSFEKSIAAVNQMLTRVGYNKLADVPHMETVQKELLEDAVVFCEELLKQDGGAVAREEAAATYRLLGNIYSFLGDYKASEEAYFRARDLGEALTRELPGRVQNGLDLAHTYRNLGILYGQTGEPEKAEEHYRRSIHLNDTLSNRFPDNRDCQRNLASGYSGLAWFLKTNGRYQESEETYGRAIEISERLVVDLPDEVETRVDLVDNYLNLGNLFALTGRDGEAEKWHLRALELHGPLMEEFPNTARYREQLGAILNDLGTSVSRTGRLQDAVDYFRKAAEIRGKLASDFPSKPLYRDSHASTLSSLGFRLRETGKLEEAMKAFNESLTLRRTLFDDFPENVAFRLQLATDLAAFAWFQTEDGASEIAERNFKEALTIEFQLTTEFPDQPVYRHELGATYTNLGLLYKSCGRFKDAEEAYRQAIASQRGLVSEFPDVPQYSDYLAKQWHNLGWVLYFTSQFEEAEKAVRESVRLHEQLASEHPEHRAYLRDLATHYDLLGVLLRLPMRLKEAKQASQQAVLLKKQLAESFPQIPSYRYDLAGGYVNLAFLQEFEEAIKSLHAASRILETLVDDYPSLPGYKTYLALAHVALGTRYAETKTGDAEASYRQALALLEELTRDYPEQPRYQGHLARALSGLAEVFAARADLEQARGHVQRAIDCQTEALRLNPKDNSFRRDLAKHNGVLATVLIRQGDYEAATDAAQNLIQQPPKNAEHAFDAACLLSRCAGLAEDDTSLAESDRKSTVQFYADQAVEFLNQAVKLGLSDVELVKEEPDFGAIRSHPTYLEIVGRLEQARPGG